MLSVFCRFVLTVLASLRPEGQGKMLWIFRYFLLCVSFTNLVTAGDQCRIEINIRGMALKGFVFKRMTVAALHICDILCEREITCQSYNFNRKEQICELNNRTKDARPENFLSDPEWFHIRRFKGRGFTAVFTNLGKGGAKGPDSVGSHYTGQDHDGQVTVSNGIQLWTVLHTGEYRIETIGASGGYSEDSVINGGRGARIIGNFMLTKGENISILVGQRGQKAYSNKETGSGGGGTFVVRGKNKPLIIAGGGGGVANMTEQHSGCDASINTTGNAGYNSPPLSGGSNGEGGQTDTPPSGGGGGGFYSNGEDSKIAGRGGKGGGSRALSLKVD